MPKKIQNFAKSALVKPGKVPLFYSEEWFLIIKFRIVANGFKMIYSVILFLVLVNVGRAGAASLDVIQVSSYDYVFILQSEEEPTPHNKQETKYL